MKCRNNHSRLSSLLVRFQTHQNFSELHIPLIQARKASIWQVDEDMVQLLSLYPTTQKNLEPQDTLQYSLKYRYTQVQTENCKNKGANMQTKRRQLSRHFLQILDFATCFLFVFSNNLYLFLQFPSSMYFSRLGQAVFAPVFAPL